MKVDNPLSWIPTIQPNPNESRATKALDLVKTLKRKTNLFSNLTTTLVREDHRSEEYLWARINKRNCQIKNQLDRELKRSHKLLIQLLSNLVI